jgi:hypothetical protein
MVPADSFVYFLKHILYLRVRETLEKWLGVSSSVKYSSNKHVPS